MASVLAVLALKYVYYTGRSFLVASRALEIPRNKAAQLYVYNACVFVA